MHFYKVFLVLMALFWVGLTDFWIYRLRSETQPLHIPFMEYQFFTSAPADCKIVFSHKITLDIAIADPDGFVKLFNLEERPFHLWWMNGMGVFAVVEKFLVTGLDTGELQPVGICLLDESQKYTCTTPSGDIVLGYSMFHCSETDINADTEMVSSLYVEYPEATTEEIKKQGTTIEVPSRIGITDGRPINTKGVTPTIMGVVPM